jgi:(p)ppGpp synthase/HD superfamily hydrolase
MGVKNMSEKIEKAVQFAAEKHAGQVRKGTTRPYISHSLEVKEILETENCSEEVIIAGILHDTIEDTGTKPEEIKALFGEKVLDIVKAESEDKSKSWKERKLAAINHLQSAPLEVKLVCCADKVSNLRDMTRDMKVVGKKIWKRFNSTPKQLKWYYQSIYNVIGDLGKYKMYGEYKILIERVFRGIRYIKPVKKNKQKSDFPKKDMANLLPLSKEDAIAAMKAGEQLEDAFQSADLAKYKWYDGEVLCHDSYYDLWDEGKVIPLDKLPQLYRRIYKKD